MDCKRRQQQQQKQQRNSEAWNDLSRCLGQSCSCWLTSFDIWLVGSCLPAQVMQQIDGGPLFLLRCASRNASLQTSYLRREIYYSSPGTKIPRACRDSHTRRSEELTVLKDKLDDQRCKTLAATSQMLKSHDCHALDVDPGFFDLSHFSFESSLSPFLKDMP